MPRRLCGQERTAIIVCRTMYFALSPSTYLPTNLFTDLPAYQGVELELGVTNLPTFLLTYLPTYLGGELKLGVTNLPTLNTYLPTCANTCI